MTTKWTFVPQLKGPWKVSRSVQAVSHYETVRTPDRHPSNAGIKRTKATFVRGEKA